MVVLRDGGLLVLSAIRASQRRSAPIPAVQAIFGHLTMKRQPWIAHPSSVCVSKADEIARIQKGHERSKTWPVPCFRFA